MIENGVYSPYREIERLTKENDVKDRQITELMTQLETAKNEGDELREADLITKIVEHSVKLGTKVAMNVELVLRRIYSGTNKFSKYFKWLEDYIAETVSSKDILKAIAEVNETLKKKKNSEVSQIVINGDIVEGDKVNEKTVIPNVGNYRPEIQTQTMNLPLPPMNHPDQNLLEDE
jgi:hypothetical protein